MPALNGRTSVAANPNPIIGTMALASVRLRRFGFDSRNYDEKMS